MEEELKPQLGRLVKVLKGRDSDKYAVIVGVVDHRYVMIADGDKRKFDQPKRKNIAHLELQPSISSEVVNSINESGRVSNGKLRYTVTKYSERIMTDAAKKGE